MVRNDRHLAVAQLVHPKRTMFRLLENALSDIGNIYNTYFSVFYSTENRNASEIS